MNTQRILRWKKLITLTLLAASSLTASAQYLGPDAYTIPNWAHPWQGYNTTLSGQTLYRGSDYDKDADVDVADLSTFWSDYDDQIKYNIFRARSDHNLSGKVDLGDYGYLSYEWGKYTPIKSADLYLAVTPTFAYAYEKSVVLNFKAISFFTSRNKYRWELTDIFEGFKKIGYSNILYQSSVRNGGVYYYDLWIKVPKGTNGIRLVETGATESGLTEEIPTQVFYWHVPLNTINPIKP